MGLFKWLFGSNKDSSKQEYAVHADAYDASNPNEILKIVGAMCLIAANAGDSHVYVALQDENPARGFSKGVTLLASIDNCSGSCTHDKSSYLKFGISPKTAEYLATVPFKTKTGALDNHFEINFITLPDYPSSLTNAILNEMKKGVSQSRFIQAGVRTAQIRSNAGVLSCSIKD